MEYRKVRRFQEAESVWGTERTYTVKDRMFTDNGKEEAMDNGKTESRDRQTAEVQKEAVRIRVMEIRDYDKVYALWNTIKGFGIRSIDDSREGVERFLRRNPTTSVVAEDAGEIVGAILCGHDGRRGCFYHVCVKEEYRKHGIGKRMAETAAEALKKEHISKVNLIAFDSNQVGNRFWKSMGWTFRNDLNYYELVLNEKNITTFR